MLAACLPLTAAFGPTPSTDVVVEHWEVGTAPEGPYVFEGVPPDGTVRFKRQ